MCGYLSRNRKGACHQAWQLEFSFPELHVEGENCFFRVVLWSTHTPWHLSPNKYIHVKQQKMELGLW